MYLCTKFTIDPVQGGDSCEVKMSDTVSVGLHWVYTGCHEELRVLWTLRWLGKAGSIRGVTSDVFLKEIRKSTQPASLTYCLSSQPGQPSTQPWVQSDLQILWRNDPPVCDNAFQSTVGRYLGDIKPNLRVATQTSKLWFHDRMRAVRCQRNCIKPLLFTL